MKEKTILEIGSGNLKSHTHLERENVIHIDIIRNSHHIENICDTHKLPFTDNVFDVVYIAHVLEHCKNPCKVIEELKRVSKRKVIIAVPNCEFYKNIGECDEHIYSWNTNTLFHLLSFYFPSVEIESRFKVREGGNKPKQVFKYLFFSILALISRNKNDLIAVCLK